jgi:prepilin-type N-terminal cleavage/methylation domain-containing protein
MKPTVHFAMKTHTTRRLQGFTLVELLVVITIIAVLAGAGFAAGTAAVQKAKKVTALATCTSMEQAIGQFYTEYNSMPKASITEGTPVDTTATDGKELIDVLLGLETGAATLNNRSVRFLSVKEGKGNKNGLIYTTGATPKADGLYDPWGGSYKVEMDGDYDEVVRPQPKGGAAAATLNGRRVAVWSDGADGVSAAGKTADDVKTW